MPTHAHASGHNRHAEFTALLHEHRRIVFKVAAAYAFSPADREDLAQDIATQLWRAWPSYDRARRLTTWMYRVALNTAMTHARNEAARHRFSSDLPGVAIEDLPAEPRTGTAIDDMLLLSQALASLGRHDRALLLLYLEARSTAEIADILGLSSSNVTTRIGRLKSALSQRFADTNPETRS